MLIVKGVLPADALATLRAALAKATFVDGATTAGPQAKKAKRNLQLARGSDEADNLGRIVSKALAQGGAFFAAALPHRVLPPLFNRYESGMEYDDHVDNAYMSGPKGQPPIRVDVAATLFLSDPASYDGGELVVQAGAIVHRVKLPAGDMVVYPAGHLHRVMPVTRGTRDAAVLWVQSMVRDAGRRQLLHDLDRATQSLAARDPDAPEIGALTQTYHALLREWIEL